MTPVSVLRPTSDAPRPLIHVACGVLVKAGREVLLAQRPAGKIAAGYWEFPGGKIEPGEAAKEALARELREEIGIELTDARPLIRLTHHYPNRSILLDTWLVTRWQGQPHGREDQALQWLLPQDFASAAPLLPTVAPIAKTLQLPAHYVFTPPDASLEAILNGLTGLPDGALLRLRQPALGTAEYARRAVALQAALQGRDLSLVLDGDPALAMRLGAHGWHARAEQLHDLQARPALPLCTASAHNAQELAKAQSLGLDAAVVGPVQATRTHPGAPALGWQGFTTITQGAGLPVYAIGGLGPESMPDAHAAYAQGVAGISAYWR